MKRYQMYTLDWCDKLQREIKVELKRQKCHFNLDNAIELTKKDHGMSYFEVSKYADLYPRIMQHRVRNQAMGLRYYQTYMDIVKLLTEVYNMSHAIYLHVPNWQMCKDMQGHVDMEVFKRIPVNTQIIVETESDTHAFQINFIRSNYHDKDVIYIHRDVYTKDREFRHYGTFIWDLDTPEKLYLHDQEGAELTDELKIGDAVFQCSTLTTEEFVDCCNYESCCHFPAGSDVYYSQIIVATAYMALKTYLDSMVATEKYVRVKSATKSVSKHNPHYEVITITKPIEPPIQKSKKGKKEVKCGPDQFSYIDLSTLIERKIREKKPWQGGHHKSPVPHPVSGHDRHYKNGKVVKIAPYHTGRNVESDAPTIQKIVEVK